MAENTVVYKGGYKYQLHETYEVTVRINPPEDIKADYRNGFLRVTIQKKNIKTRPVSIKIKSDE